MGMLVCANLYGENAHPGFPSDHGHESYNGDASRQGPDQDVLIRDMPISGHAHWATGSTDVPDKSHGPTGRMTRRERRSDRRLLLRQALLRHRHDALSSTSDERATRADGEALLPRRCSSCDGRARPTIGVRGDGRSGPAAEAVQAVRGSSQAETATAAVVADTLQDIELVDALGAEECPLFPPASGTHHAAGVIAVC